MKGSPHLAGTTGPPLLREMRSPFLIRIIIEIQLKVDLTEEKLPLHKVGKVDRAVPIDKGAELQTEVDSMTEHSNTTGTTSWLSLEAGHHKGNGIGKVHPLLIKVQGQGITLTTLGRAEEGAGHMIETIEGGLLVITDSQTPHLLRAVLLLLTEVKLTLPILNRGVTMITMLNTALITTGRDHLVDKTDKAGKIDRAVPTDKDLTT